MKRELKQLQPRQDECCPNHDTWPTECYKIIEVRKLEVEIKKKEHKYVRTLVRRLLYKLIPY